MSPSSALSALYPPLRVCHPKPLVSQGQSSASCLPEPSHRCIPGSVRVFGCNWQKPTQAHLGKTKQNKNLERYGLIHITEEEWETWTSEQKGTRATLRILVTGPNEESLERVALGMMGSNCFFSSLPGLKSMKGIFDWPGLGQEKAGTLMDCCQT